MYVILEPDLFIDRVDKLLSRWRNLSGKMLHIAAKDEPGQTVTFKCDTNTLTIPARVKEPGNVLVAARNAIKAIRMYSRMFDVEIQTQGRTIVFKQRNFTMNLPCVTDETPASFGNALEIDRISLLKKEKRRLREEIRRIDNEITSMSGATSIRRRRP